MKKWILLALSLFVFSACGEKEVNELSLESTQIEVAEDGTFFIKGKAKSLSSLYLNGNLLTNTGMDKEGNFKTLVQMNEPVSTATFIAKYASKEIGKEELQFDTTLYEKALDAQTQESIAVQESIDQEQNQKSIEQEKKASEENETLKQVNNEIAKHISDNQGWALGNIDRDGNPTDSGTPNADYTNWLFINSINYNGMSADIQVTADFLNLSESEKNEISSSIQNIIISYAGLDSKPAIYVYNGENSYGGSRLLDKNSFKWNN